MSTVADGPEMNVSGRVGSSLPVADAEHPQRVTRGVVCHPVREIGAHVVDPEDVDQELRQLIRLGCRRLSPRGQRLIAGCARNHRVLVADGARARSRRHHYRVIGLEHVDVPPHQIGLEVAAVGVHLPAAGLLERELHRLAQALEELDRGPAGVGEQRVAQACGEQGDASRHERHGTRREVRGTWRRGIR